VKFIFNSERKIIVENILGKVSRASLTVGIICFEIVTDILVETFAPLITQIEEDVFSEQLSALKNFLCVYGN
jgi:hypothetical protein